MPPTQPFPTSLAVRVPASTSNLGAGFDQLGLALDLPLEVRLEGPIPAMQHELVLEDELARAWPTENNRLLVAFDRLFEHGSGKAPGGPPRFRFHVQTQIPLCRGLGSSGAATAAGLLLAAELLAMPGWGAQRLCTDRIEQLGVELEGHPDNVIASLHGGCTLGVVLGNGQLRVVQQELHPDLLFPVAWPSTPLSTAEARAAMPNNMSLEDAVWNTRRLSLLLEGLRTASADLLAHGVDDRLHTPYRLPLIPGAPQALNAARTAGALFAAISGSGSALVAAHTQENQAHAIARAMGQELAREHAAVQCRVLRPDLLGARMNNPAQ